MGSEHSTSLPDFGFWNLGFGFWILEVWFWILEFWFRVEGWRWLLVGSEHQLHQLAGYKWTVDKQGGRFIHRPPVNPKSEEFLHQMKKKAQVPKVQLLRRDDSEP